jgi:hypothetical protein
MVRHRSTHTDVRTPVLPALKQTIVLDDAGDAGFKFRQGSSRYLVIACVVFDDPLDAEYASVVIRMFRRSLGWKDTHEFKFNKNRRKDKLAFLSEIKKCNFKIRAIVVDKMAVSERSQGTSSREFYLSVIRDVLVRFADRMENAKIIIDGDDLKQQAQRVRLYLRRALNTNKQKMRTFQPADSVKEGLVQLADMVAGSIYRSLQPDKTDHDDCLSIIENKVEDLWLYP